MIVIGPNGEEVGKVEEILVNGEGQVVAITVDIGGFLGVVDH
ncbi:PRC-barrel domain-containing protein [Halomonas gemina]